jgi:acetylornithine deacetylase
MIIKPDFKTMLRELIAAPSVSSTSARHDQSNMPVINLLATWLEPLGFKIEIQPLPGQPHKANLIATLGEGAGGLVFAGHTDTVPFDETGWYSSPLSLLERDNRFYGLGTCDMKGFFAIVIEALTPYLDKPLDQPIIILATADEESSMAGAQALAAAGKPKARYAIIGEPTGMVPVYKHKSIMMQSISIEGKAGHSSNPLLGINALDIMHDVIGSLMAYRSQLQQEFTDPAFKVAYPTINLGCIHGGDNPNRICSHCELHFDTRLLPGMDNEGVSNNINEIVQSIAGKRGVNIKLTPLIDGVEAFAQSLDSPLVAAAQKFTGNEAQSVAFATEAPFLQNLGMETLVLGPGDIDQAHQTNEFVEISRIAPMEKVIQQLIERFCFES